MLLKRFIDSCLVIRV